MLVLFAVAIHFSAWLRHKHKNSKHNSNLCLQRLNKLQEYLVNDLLPKRCNQAKSFVISLSELQPLIRKKGFNFLNNDLLQLVSSWRNRGCRLTTFKRGRWQVDLKKDWHNFQQSLKQRTDIASHILDYLGKIADRQGLRGEQLVFFTLDALTDSLKSTAHHPTKPSEALTQALLFLDEQSIINLDQGLALFRQAMTLSFEDDVQKGGLHSKTLPTLSQTL